MVSDPARIETPKPAKPDTVVAVSIGAQI